VLVVNEDYTLDSAYIRHISDTLADVEEQPASAPRPVAVPLDVRWWRRTTPADARPASNASSSDAPADATNTAAIAIATTAASATSTAMDTSTSTTELKEPSLFGRARELLGDLAYPSENPMQWLSDTHLANAHEADERPTGSVPVRYNYPRPSSMVPDMFKQRGVVCVGFLCGVCFGVWCWCGVVCVGVCWLWCGVCVCVGCGVVCWFWVGVVCVLVFVVGAVWCVLAMGSALYGKRQCDAPNTKGVPCTVWESFAGGGDRESVY
jgi:hypothetical protein